MSESAVTSLSCTQCGGELHPSEAELFLTCPYCSATVYLDPGQAVFHWFLTPTIDPQQAGGQLNRWMSGSQTIKDLDKKARVVDQAFQYFPMWYFLTAQNNQESTQLEPAAAISITELTHLHLPAGDLKPFAQSVEAQSTAPSVPLETARTWLLQKKPWVEIRQCSLVHIPIYVFKYTYRNQTYTAVVEAGTGTVLANLFPAKAEAPYLIAGGLTAIIYLCLAFFALGDSMFMGFVFDGAIALLIGLIVAPFLFIFAVLVASRV